MKLLPLKKISQLFGGDAVIDADEIVGYVITDTGNYHIYFKGMKCWQVTRESYDRVKKYFKNKESKVIEV